MQLIQATHKRKVRICLECGAIVDWIDFHGAFKEYPNEGAMFFYSSIQKFLQ
jgi:hypothetical protein